MMIEINRDKLIEYLNKKTLTLQEKGLLAYICLTNNDIWLNNHEDLPNNVKYVLDKLVIKLNEGIKLIGGDNEEQE